MIECPSAMWSALVAGLGGLLLGTALFYQRGRSRE